MARAGRATPGGRWPLSRTIAGGTRPSTPPFLTATTAVVGTTGGVSRTGRRSDGIVGESEGGPTLGSGGAPPRWLPAGDRDVRRQGGARAWQTVFAGFWRQARSFARGRALRAGLQQGRAGGLHASGGDVPHRRRRRARAVACHPAPGEGMWWPPRRRLHRTRAVVSAREGGGFESCPGCRI